MGGPASRLTLSRPPPPALDPPRDEGAATLTRYDRYALGAQVQAFGVFALILAMVWWINGAVALVDTLLRDGQNVGTFLEFSALSLPGVVRIAVPLAAVAAALYVANRQRADSEVVAAHAAGASSLRLARPVLLLGLVAGLLLALVVHLLLPLARERLDVRTAQVAEGATARLLTPGAFVEPADGVTFYVREITPASELLDVLLSDARDPERRALFTARRALLLPAEEGRGAQLLMFDGLSQVLRGGRLYTTRFEDFLYDLALFSSGGEAAPPGPRDLTTAALVRRDDLGARRWDEVARRTAESLTAVAGALLGFSAMMQGAFNRGGTWRQVVLGVFLVIAMKLLEGAATSAIGRDGTGWPLHFVSPLAGAALAAFLLWNADRARRPRRRWMVPA
ncbi:lipopolysaccharide export system permease protein [Hasllibacter halocynthiae]|uniref:Lipopolysaccharide export system permease protein n=2 Tax=Hasllibacter halocynthiae TaxID=595589 RepID=A0A2T0X7Q6_9RHOB|nr:LptF/LptG family permease [Hasllibacter halocynthiae]PRY94957.1 lipopolysaccharide export system permease protein [Hasllibacter halocynthiae]